MNDPNGNKTNYRRDGNPTIAEIRAARERAGLTQTEAARRIHSTLRAWQCWESEGEENRRMHPGLFELFLIKTGQTDVLGRGDANDGNGIDVAAQLDECVAEVAEIATQSAQEVAGRLASGVCEDLFCPPPVKAEEAAELYVTRYGLRRIAKPLVEATARARLYIVR